MRITNKSYTPIEVIAELFASVGVTEQHTADFFVEDHMSHDWLVSEFKHKVNVVLDFFERYGSEIAATQSVRDEGVDVRLSFHKGGEQEHRVGFQFKSEKEALADEARRRSKKPGETMTSVLKRQGYEAFGKAGVDEWWVITCFDLVKHRKLVDLISSDVMGVKFGPMKPQFKGPLDAYRFLSMEDSEIAAICTLLLCEDDEILIQARKDVLRLDPISQRLIAYTIYRGFEGSKRITTPELRSLAGDGVTVEQIAPSLGRLEDIGYLEPEGDGSVHGINPAVLQGVSALYFEARVRHEYDHPDVGDYMYRMFALSRPKEPPPRRSMVALAEEENDEDWDD